MQLTVRQAALQAGVSRQTLFRYIKEGKISATLSHIGEKQIDITELLRVFGERLSATVTPATHHNKPRQSQSDNQSHVATTLQVELERLKAQLKFKEAELELAKERIQELKQREASSAEEKNRLLSLIEQQTRLLTAPQTTTKDSRKSLESDAQESIKDSNKLIKQDKIKIMKKKNRK